MIKHLSSLVAPVLLAGCGGSTISDAVITGDENACTIALVCSDGTCGGVAYTITCTLNANNTYDCVCASGGTDGETFQEAEVCAGGDEFPNLPIDDVSAHAVDDCHFPLAPAAE